MRIDPMMNVPSGDVRNARLIKLRVEGHCKLDKVDGALIVVVHVHPGIAQLAGAVSSGQCK